ncbi:MAG: DNA polymerase III subunit delta [Dictyoglomus sp. NZ13-RE01]|nr:MAG: DNA polymerase III subunit delta [Dictyoglomus sp. NZ13-RE01]
MNYWEFRRLIKEKNIPSVYLFVGEEKFLMEDALQALRNRLKGASYHAFFGEDITWKEIMPFLETSSLFGVQMVVIRHAQNLKEPSDKDRISLLFKKLTNTFIVFMANAEEEKTKKNYLLKLVPPQGIVEFSKLKSDGIRRWLNEKIKEFGKEIDQDSLYFLTVSWGENLALLYRELEKVVYYVGDKKEITLEDVKATASPREVAFFTFLDAIQKRDVYTALWGLDTLWNEGMFPMVILEIIIKQFRQLLRVHTLKNEGYSEEEIAKKLDLHPFVVRKTIWALSNYTAAELLEFYMLLRQLDMEFKSTAKDERILLERFLIRLGTNLAG